MSGQGVPGLPKVLKLTGNPAYDGLILKGIIASATAIVYWAAGHLHVSDPNEITAAIVFAVALGIGGSTALWGFIMSKINQAQAVNAGINLATSGNALASDGKTVVSINDGTTPPLPATTVTAPEIVKNFAPAK